MHCNGKMKEESGSFPAGTLTPQLFPHHPPPSHQLQLNLTLTPPLPPPTPHVPSDVRSVLYLFSNCSLFTVVPYFTMPAFVFAAFYELCDKFPAIEATFTKHETGDYRPA